MIVPATLTCGVCHETVRIDYAAPVKAVLRLRNLCHTCDFWIGKIALRYDLDHMSNIVRAGGTHYYITRNEGAGYSECYIRFFTGEVVGCLKLGHNGEIPERFREYLPDNAELLEYESGPILLLEYREKVAAEKEALAAKERAFQESFREQHGMSFAEYEDRMENSFEEAFPRKTITITTKVGSHIVFATKEPTEPLRGTDVTEGPVNDNVFRKAAPRHIALSAYDPLAYVLDIRTNPRVKNIAVVTSTKEQMNLFAAKIRQHHGGIYSATQTRLDFADGSRIWFFTEAHLDRMRGHRFERYCILNAEKYESLANVIEIVLCCLRPAEGDSGPFGIATK